MATFALVLTISFLGRGAWFQLLAMTVGLWLLAVVVSIPLGQLLRRSFVVLPFIVGALALPFTTPGDILWRLPLLGWGVTGAGLAAAGALIWRAWLAVQSFVLLSGTTPIEEVLWSLQALKVPALFLAIVGFAYRYLYVLVEEAGRMLRARRSRMPGKPRGRWTLSRRLRAAGGLIGTLFLRALARSERVYEAMLGRGYDGTVRQPGHPRMGAGEWWGLMGLFVALGAILLWTGLGG